MDQTIQPSKGTVYYERKINSEARSGGHKYENEIAGVYVQFDMTPDPATTQRAIDQAFNQAKASVFEQLGIPMAFDAQGQVTPLQPQPVAAPAPMPTPAAATYPVETVVAANVGAPALEQVVAAFPGATVEQNVAPTTVAPVASGVGPVPPFAADTQDKGQRQANKDWAIARLQSNPDEFWDNRPKKASGQFSPKAPDFKHKTLDLPVWL